jgi:hypothetical protein
VFEEVGDPCNTWSFIAGADAIPDLYRDQWYGVIFENQDFEAVIQAKRLDIQMKRLSRPAQAVADDAA